MSRRRQAEKRNILPDPVYGNKILAKFMNLVMKHGKKSIAEQVVYKVLDNLKEATKENPLEVFQQIIDKVGPMLEVKSRRVGGATYQVPVEVTNERKTALAMRWIINAARKRSEKGFAARLLAEFKDILAGRGSALKVREDMHKMAEANKAFAHFRW
jgi:small subunit ribosomal protein S7